MTAGERAAKAVRDISLQPLLCSIVRQITEAVAEERDACEAIARNCADEETEPHPKNSAILIADAIHSRGETE